MAKVQELLDSVPTRKPYYPGTTERMEAFLEHYPDARKLGTVTQETLPWLYQAGIPAREGEYALTEEPFCGVLTVAEIDASEPEDYLKKAVQVANDCMWGSLACMITIDPRTRKRHRQAFEEALSELRYGAIGVNLWAGVAYGLGSTSWGAFPGNPATDIESGVGSVHNALMIDHPEKSVVYAPFVSFPRPPWFPNHRTLNPLGPAMTRLEHAPGLLNFLRVLAVGLRG